MPASSKTVAGIVTCEKANVTVTRVYRAISERSITARSSIPGRLMSSGRNTLTLYVRLLRLKDVSGSQFAAKNTDFIGLALRRLQQALEMSAAHTRVVSSTSSSFWCLKPRMNSCLVPGCSSANNNGVEIDVLGKPASRRDVPRHAGKLQDRS
jgi:hypothetical protein